MTGTPTALSGLFAGRYLIDREIGRGGSAIVYLARDQQRGHDVALKVLRLAFAGAGVEVERAVQADGDQRCDLRASVRAPAESPSTGVVKLGSSPIVAS